MTLKELIDLFRQGEEPNFIKFLDRLEDEYGEKKSPYTDRPKRQSNRPTD